MSGTKTPTKEEDNDLLPESMRATREVVSRLHSLLQNPEPGLMSWMTMTLHAAKAVHKNLKDSGVST